MRSSDVLPIRVRPLDSESDQMDITVLGTEMLVKTKYSNLFLFLIHVLIRFSIISITHRFS